MLIIDYKRPQASPSPYTTQFSRFFFPRPPQTPPHTHTRSSSYTATPIMPYLLHLHTPLMTHHLHQAHYSPTIDPSPHPHPLYTTTHP